MQHTPEFTERVNSISDLYKQGLKAFTEAGIIVAELVDSTTHAYAKILEVAPHMTENILSMLEKLGRGTLVLELMVGNNPGAKMLRKMPIEIQRVYTAEKIPALTPDGDTLLVHYSHLTASQVSQLTGYNDGKYFINGLPAQKVRMTLMSNYSCARKSRKKPLFYLEEGRLHASAKGSMSGRELLAFARAYTKWEKDNGR